MTSHDPRDPGTDIFDILDDHGIDMDDPKWAGMDAFDVFETLNVDLDDPEATR